MYPFTVFCVAVKPEVEPFSITDYTLNEGGSTRLFCSVSSGDMPIHFIWTKNGHLMNTNRVNIKIQQLDELTSIFSLTRVSLEDAGNYSCIAKNEAGSASHTASLKVMGKLLAYFINCILYFGFWSKSKLLTFENTINYWKMAIVLFC